MLNLLLNFKNIIEERNNYMKIETYTNFSLGDTICFNKEYANQRLVKKDAVRCFEMLKKQKYKFETKVLSVPRARTGNQLFIDVSIPVYDVQDDLDSFYRWEKKKIVSQQGIKVQFSNSPVNFERAFKLIKEFCDEKGINVKDKQMLELTTLDDQYTAKTFCILMDFGEEDYAKVK